jgi:hypothetical protein
MHVLERQQEVSKKNNAVPFWGRGAQIMTLIKVGSLIRVVFISYPICKFNTKLEG